MPNAIAHAHAPAPAPAPAPAQTCVPVPDCTRTCAHNHLRTCAHSPCSMLYATCSSPDTSLSTGYASANESRMKVEKDMKTGGNKHRSSLSSQSYRCS